VRSRQHNSVANILDKLSRSSEDASSSEDIRLQLQREKEGRWRLPPADTNQPSILGRRELLALAQARSNKFTDFQVTFQRVEDKPNGQKVQLSRATVVLKGFRVYIDHYYSFDPNATPYEFRRIIAYNGRKTTLYEPKRALATVKAEQSHEVDTQYHDFFNLNLLNVPRNDRLGPGLRNSLKAGLARGTGDQSLVSMLRDSKTTVRPLLEKIGEHNCHVIDGENCTVWLDANRGCVPLRQVFRDKRRPKLARIQFQVRRVTEVSPGFWVATRGRRIEPRSEIIVIVNGWVNNKPAIKVNAGVPDEFFDLWKHLPPGTEVWRDTDTMAWSFVDQNSVSR